jgi:molybdopterin-binding protein
MTIYKAPFEQFAVSLDFAADIGSGNSIASIVSVKAVSDLTGLDSTEEVIATTPAPTISGTAVAFEVTGGAVGETHTISVQIISSIGEKYQGDVTLRIVG